jgi:Sulfotransferase family
MIVGTPRSGTTLVQRLASELPGVRVPPETHFFRSFVPGLLKRRVLPLRRADIVQELETFLELDTSRGLEFQPEAVAARLDGRCATVSELFAALVRELAGDGRLYGEKTPSHLRWWPLLTRWMPELRMVFVVRDPRAVVASYFAAWGVRPHAVVAERWAIDQQQVALAERRLGETGCLVLRYEDVVVDVEASRRRLAAFLGASCESTAISAPLSLPWETWKAGAGEPVREDRTDAWRVTLPDRVWNDIETITGGEMMRFGYTPERPGVRALDRATRAQRRRYRLDRIREHRAIELLATQTS